MSGLERVRSSPILNDHQHEDNDQFEDSILNTTLTSTNNNINDPFGINNNSSISVIKTRDDNYISAVLQKRAQSQPNVLRFAPHKNINNNTNDKANNNSNNYNKDNGSNNMAPIPPRRTATLSMKGAANYDQPHVFSPELLMDPRDKTNLHTNSTGNIRALGHNTNNFNNNSDSNLYESSMLFNDKSIPELDHPNNNNNNINNNNNNNINNISSNTHAMSDFNLQEDLKRFSELNDFSGLGLAAAATLDQNHSNTNNNNNNNRSDSFSNRGSLYLAPGPMTRGSLFDNPSNTNTSNYYYTSTNHNLTAPTISNNISNHTNNNNSNSRSNNNYDLEYPREIDKIPSVKPKSNIQDKLWTQIDVLDDVKRMSDEAMQNNSFFTPQYEQNLRSLKKSQMNLLNTIKKMEKKIDTNYNKRIWFEFDIDLESIEDLKYLYNREHFDSVKNCIEDVRKELGQVSELMKQQQEDLASDTNADESANGPSGTSDTSGTSGTDFDSSSRKSTK